MTKVRYVNVSIPDKLAHAIDEYIKDNPKLDFRSRAQVVIHALRDMMIESEK
jgi:metal-responsive CopG/Arc/MetJ family transcriptional regulator